MKNKATRALRLMLLSAAVIVLTGTIIAWAKPLVAHTQTGKQNMHPVPMVALKEPKLAAQAVFTGYPVNVQDGGIYCAQYFTVYVEHEGQEINTGTVIWLDAATTVPYPNSIVTSLSGSTRWQSFFITNGIVGGPAVPC